MSAALWLCVSACVLLGSRAVLQRDVLKGKALSLNDMFREVEELMEDTQHMLEEAVDQIKNESSRSNSDRNHLSSVRNLEDGDVRIEVSAATVEECMVDEDCGELHYCQSKIQESRCLPCIPTDMPCTKDEECCSEQMCVWGQCTVNATRGREGTICQGQSDCEAGLCCAFQRELLFPVCNPRPKKGEACLSHPNLLMDMLAWDQEGPRDHCPCAGPLQCRLHRLGAACGE
ncbi:dickkopf-related protein 3b isoform X1 [Synchiropus splendidus]|uniref:dickkopf-related protein 3b isoform X1 n=1 Tax=Synchiropus splendidus TaxID=270530 RepID=UPI00237DB8AC|nr:dickkopf-related protein 3b isoform X1 [Synchiropus splendidus]